MKNIKDIEKHNKIKRECPLHKRISGRKNKKGHVWKNNWEFPHQQKT